MIYSFSFYFLALYSFLYPPQSGVGPNLFEWFNIKRCSILPVFKLNMGFLLPFDICYTRYMRYSLLLFSPPSRLTVLY